MHPPYCTSDLGTAGRVAGNAHSQVKSSGFVSKGHTVSGLKIWGERSHMLYTRDNHRKTPTNDQTNKQKRRGGACAVQKGAQDHSWAKPPAGRMESRGGRCHSHDLDG